MQTQLFKDQYIVVTGGMGSVGSCVVRYLNDLGYENIVIVDDFGQKQEKWHNLLGKRIWEFISHNELFTWLDQHANETAAIIHLGAIQTSAKNDDYYYLNYNYSVQLASFALNYDIRFIYASCAKTYGDGNQGFLDSEQQLDRLRPTDIYSLSKHLFDLWLYRKGFFDRVVGLKYFPVFGCNERYLTEDASIVYKIYTQARTTGQVTLPEAYQGMFTDWIYVKDVAVITCDFLFNTSNGLYNVGTGHSTPIEQMVQNVFLALQQPYNLQFAPDIDGPIMYNSTANMEKMDNLYQSWQKQRPYTQIPEAVKDYVQRYLLLSEVW